MKSKVLESNYKAQIANVLSTQSDNIFFYWKGRVALYAILQAMGVAEGDEIILPAFTCVVVPNAIKYLKAKPIYVDIDPTTYNMNFAKLEAAISSRTKVIICQNTFGLSSNVEKIRDFATAHNIFTIEDCTHGFGGYYEHQPNGTYCDAAFYSTQWNKPFSTGVGGFAFVKDDKLREKIKKINTSLAPTTFKDAISLRVLYFVREKLLTQNRYWVMVKFYRFLSKYKLVQGSSSGQEIQSTTMPSNYFKAISTTQIKKGIQNVGNLPKLQQLRRENAIIYNDFLSKNHKTIVLPQLFENHSFLKFPLLVSERDKVLEIAEQNKIPLGEWFCSPLHPVLEHFENWDLDVENFPIATQISKQMLNLPTDVEDIEPILKFLEKIKHYIV